MPARLDFDEIDFKLNFDKVRGAFRKVKNVKLERNLIIILAKKDELI